MASLRPGVQRFGRASAKVSVYTDTAVMPHWRRSCRDHLRHACMGKRDTTDVNANGHRPADSLVDRPTTARPIRVDLATVLGMLRVKTGRRREPSDPRPADDPPDE